MQVVCKHVAANCNPKPNVLRFMDPDHLVFAFSNQLGIYQLSQNTIITTIRGMLCAKIDREVNHNRVNCITVTKNQPVQWIFCGYDSGQLTGYCSSNNSWIKATTVKGDSLLSIELLQHEKVTHIFTNDSNSNIKHYVLQEDGLKLVDQLRFPLNKLIETVCPYVVNGKLILFLGGADQYIHYYQKDVASKDAFEYKFSLAGHENAITKVVITAENQQDLLLASSSKDGYIRLWRITPDKDALKFHKNVHTLLENYHVFLESVLISHECSVTSLEWTRFGGKLQLVSCSLDSTLCIWEHQENAWTVESRLGQFIGNKNAYFDAKADSQFQHLIALNYTGAVLIWKWSPEKFALRESFNGHASEVNGIEWNHTGDFLVSVSKDQTTRVIAKNNKTQKFNQISRAQIHGYDINAVTTIKVKENTLDVIVCGADEKVIRLVEPPACFANYLNTYTEANLHLFFNSEKEQAQYLVSKPQDKVLRYEAYSEGGTQVLGLMTKNQRVEREKITSYYEEENEGGIQETVAEENEDLSKAKVDYSEPPHEDFLVKHTLWPEVNKLYGHPHEIQQVVHNSTHTILASACKALSKDSGSIILWDTKTWKILKILPFHNFTIYGLEFSPSDKYLSSVSKDRKMAVYSNDFTMLFNYEAHLRAITCLSFHLSEEYIITGSRDKHIKLHSISKQKIIDEINLKQPISAIAFARTKQHQGIFIVGCFNGDIYIGAIENEKLSIKMKLPEENGHTQEVTALKWNGNLFASSSHDFSVRIYQILGK